MEFDFDLDQIKESFFGFFYKNKKLIVVSVGFFVFVTTCAVTYFKIDYDSRITSSNHLIDYIYGENYDFLSKKHKSGYKLVKDILEYRKNPTMSDIDKFSKHDDYLFKNLFYFAKRLFFNYHDEYSSYYESDKNPWSKLIITAGVFNGERNIDLVKNKEEYLLIYAIGKGLQC